ncbi:MAG: hypothetical protein M3O70_18930 [Actinomycetota bacterium]|nr:hypothetical protein [Actinomycetota bacterium]
MSGGSSDVAQAYELPVEQEIRCGLRRLGPGAFVTAPVAALALTAASHVALVAELVVRFSGLDDSGSEAEAHVAQAGRR